jgi:hypothetical protein
MMSICRLTCRPTRVSAHYVTTVLTALGIAARLLFRHANPLPGGEQPSRPTVDGATGASP